MPKARSKPFLRGMRARVEWKRRAPFPRVIGYHWRRLRDPSGKLQRVRVPVYASETVGS